MKWLLICAPVYSATTASDESALQRGRARLRELAKPPDKPLPPTLSDEQRSRLIAYVDGFKTGEFDAVRAMLRLDLVAKLMRRGKGEVGEYYGRYASCDQWAYAAGVADGRPAMLLGCRTIAVGALGWKG